MRQHVGNVQAFLGRAQFLHLGFKEVVGDEPLTVGLEELLHFKVFGCHNLSLLWVVLEFLLFNSHKRSFWLEGCYSPVSSPTALLRPCTPGAPQGRYGLCASPLAGGW